MTRNANGQRIKLTTEHGTFDTAEEAQVAAFRSKVEAERRLRAARAQIAAALAVHTPKRNYTSGSTDPKHVPSYETQCNGCGAAYPCSTVRALSSPVTHPEPEPGTPDNPIRVPVAQFVQDAIAAAAPVVVPEFVGPQREAWLAGAQWASRRWTGHEVNPRDFDRLLDELFPAAEYEADQNR